MKRFRCVCGQRLFFDNTYCLNCNREIGFDPLNAKMVAVELQDGSLQEPSGGVYRHCKNRIDYDVCNWLVAAEDQGPYCLACELNQMIPSLAKSERRVWWSRMETAKRRLIYALLLLGLPVVSKLRDPSGGLAFAFLEDRRSNPMVDEMLVLTGHEDGKITVNLSEADDVEREMARSSMGEAYRTLLGHFRHESGHYYFDKLVRDSDLIEEFRQYFGDERLEYKTALDNYYRQGAMPDWAQKFISAYASAHPLEDWAESWAHYLHMVDSLETASDFGVIDDHFGIDFDIWLVDWMDLTVILNELNRSMGQQDAYPFVLSEEAVRKLRFVHRVIDPRKRPNSGEATA